MIMRHDTCTHTRLFWNKPGYFSFHQRLEYVNSYNIVVPAVVFYVALYLNCITTVCECIQKILENLELVSKLPGNLH